MSLLHHRTLTQLQITLRLHFPSFTAPTQLFTFISLHLFTIIQSHTHTIYTLDILSHPAEYCLACLLTKRFPCIPSLISCVLIPARVPGLFSPPSPLDIVCRSPTHACPRITLLSCPCHTCLLLPDPACIDHVV